MIRARWACHLAVLPAAIGLIGAFILRPFWPGRYDSLAVTLSFMAQLLGYGGLLLVPISLVWLVDELRRSAKRRDGPCPPRVFYFALAALAASACVAAVMSLPAFDKSFSLGCVVLLLAGWGVWALFPRLRALRRGEARGFQPALLYLIVLPAAAFLVRVTLVGPAIAASRNRAMENCAPLIRDIETYQRENGRYPASLAALWNDYPTGVVGVERFRYEPFGDAYNVYFEQFAYELPTREIVVYNPRDEQEFTSHDSWILVLSPAELLRARGHFAAHDAGRPHWKYFWFD